MKQKEYSKEEKKLKKEGAVVNLMAWPAKLIGYMSNTERKERDEYLPYPWKKVQWASDEYVEEIKQRIFNNKNIIDVTKGTTLRIATFHPEFVEKAVPKGVRWVRIDQPKEHMILTEEGALYNTQRQSMIKANISTHNITYTNESINFNWSYLFSLAGWKYDHEKVVKQYKENDWKHRDLRDKMKGGAQKKNRRPSKNAIGLYPNTLQ